MKDIFKKREKAVEARFVKLIGKLGGRAYKLASPANDGLPDRLVVLRNCMPIFVELKAEDGKLRERQKVEIAFLLDMGQNACVCIGDAGVDELMETLKEVVKNEQLRRVQSLDAGEAEEREREDGDAVLVPTGEADPEPGA